MTKRPYSRNEDVAREDLPLWGARLRFQVELSYCYHIRRAAFYDSWNNRIQLFIGLAGASAFLFLFSPGPGSANPILRHLDQLYPVFGLLIVLATLVNSVFNPSKSANHHKILAELFGGMLKELKARNLSIEDLARLQEFTEDLTNKEPQVHRNYIHFQCHNRIVMTNGFPKEYCVNFRGYQYIVQKFWGNWTNFGSEQLVPDRRLESNKPLYIEKIGVAVHN